MEMKTLEFALPLSLALAFGTFIVREALAALLHAAVHEAWSKLRNMFRSRGSRPARDGNGR